MTNEIRNQVVERLDYSFGAGHKDRRELVVIGHGVTANKDREWAITLAHALNSVGFSTLRFSFSGNGASEGDFRDSCPTKEAEDLGAVLDATTGWNVTYVGHSMGGAVGVLRASHDDRIMHLVSLAGMVDTAEFARRKFEHLKAGEAFMWDKPECPLSQIFLDDMQAIGSVEPLAGEVNVPWLLIHGTNDSVVLPEESERISARAIGDVKFITIEGADHVFSDDASNAMAAIVVAWLRARVGI